MADDVQFQTQVQLTIGSKAIGALLAGQPIIVKNASVHLHITMDDEVRQLLNGAMQTPESDQVSSASSSD